MTDSWITIHFDGNGRVYQPGETLSGEYRLDGAPADAIKAVEVSVLWHTNGKGDEDLAVHDFRRLGPDDGNGSPALGTGRFETVLPNSPLSYRGAIFKLQWCVRVRVFLSHGREVVAQKPFRLGQVAAAKVAAS